MCTRNNHEEMKYRIQNGQKKSQERFCTKSFFGFHDFWTILKVSCLWDHLKSQHGPITRHAIVGIFVADYYRAASQNVAVGRCRIFVWLDKGSTKRKLFF